MVNGLFNETKKKKKQIKINEKVLITVYNHKSPLTADVWLYGQQIGHTFKICFYKFIYFLRHNYVPHNFLWQYIFLKKKSCS
jgi:hypothetical protein